jgi:hypothetical protein
MVLKSPLLLSHTEMEEFCQSEHAAVEKEDDVKYIEEQIDLFGGREKGKQTMERMDNLFPFMKNRGLMSDDDIADFNYSTFHNGLSVKKL